MKTIYRLALGGVIATRLFFAAPLPAQIVPNSADVISAGSVVSFEYSLTDQSGTVLDSSKGKAPMTYTQGNGQIIRGLESQIVGMKLNEEKKITVKPEDAYGPVNPQAFKEVPKDKFPQDALKVGTILMASGPQVQGLPVRVHEIRENTDIIELKHPMAGKTLIFDDKIVDIKTPGH
jgi:FKBP-type peptidyl-prolyl cis-trans isomerase SlyD